ncbi:MAG TPA: type IV secretion system protein [Anaeromyxobacter sp.]|nr:type IV secretion system protein [Anaeromyxobacter sp.]
MRQGDLERYLEESRGLERDHLDELVRSRRAAWRVAGAALGLAAALVAALASLLPLKKVEPFLLRVDGATGAVEVVRPLREMPEGYGEAVDKYFLNRYVLSREGYDYQTVQATYDATVLMSAPEVQQEFRSLYEGPGARDKVLSDRVRLLVRVRSITPARDTAVVRFLRTRHAADGSEDLEESLVATIGFQYLAAPMREEDRLSNPLGFQVTSYRVDPEVVGG